MSAYFARRPLPALALLLLLNQCARHDPAPQLPPETTTGANTFGCKIDGNVFVPRDKMGKPGFYAVRYENLGSGKGGGYYLNIVMVNWQSPNEDDVRLTTDSLLVEEGKTYPLSFGKGHAQAVVTTDSGAWSSNDGEITITRFDRSNRIMSGRFHFQTGYTADPIVVTEGRFDLQF